MASRMLAAAALALLTLGSATARAEPTLALDLNRLEALPAAGTPGASIGAEAGASTGENCRIWMVLENDAQDAAAIDSLRLDLVLFGKDGRIARRAAVDLAPVAAGRTAVRLFDLAGLPCGQIGRVLVNDVLACRIGGVEARDCADRLRPSSRAGIRFGL